MALDVGQIPTPGTTGSNPTPFNAIPVEPEITTATEVETEVTTDVTQSAPNPQAEADELEARQHGWVSKEEWEADGRSPDRWKPASEFMDVRRNIQSVLRSENSELRAKIAAMELRERQRDQKTAEAQTTLTINDIKFQMREAQEAGDFAKFTELNDKLLDAKLAAQKVAPASPASSLDSQSQAEALAFKEANPWLLKDRELARNFALELKGLTDIDPQMGAAEALNSAKQRVMRLYPERFRVGNARRPPMSEMGGTTPSTVNGKSWADLNPIYRSQAEEDIRAKKYTKEEFLANCQDQPEAWRR